MGVGNLNIQFRVGNVLSNFVEVPSNFSLDRKSANNSKDFDARNGFINAVEHTGTSGETSATANCKS